MKKVTLLVLLVFMLGISSYSLEPFKPDLRDIKILNQDGSDYLIENVRWGFEDGTKQTAVFKTTNINAENIKEIYYWSKNFPPAFIGAHGMLAFVMEDKNSVVAQDGSKDVGFVVSVEAKLREGQSYSMIKGMKEGFFPIIYTVTTLTDGLQRAINVDKLTIRQYKLNLNKEQKKQVIDNLFKKAVSDLSFGYHTTKNNCVTCVLEQVDKVLEKKRKMKFYLSKRLGITNPRLTLPRLVPGYLQGKGIAEKLDQVFENDSVVNIACADGDDYNVNIQDLPGAWRMARTLSGFNSEEFENYMNAYFETSMMITDMMFISGEEQYSLTYQMTLKELQTDMDKLKGEIMSRIEKDPYDSIKFYIEKGYDLEDAARDINYFIDDIVNREIAAGNMQFEEFMQTIY